MNWLWNLLRLCMNLLRSSDTKRRVFYWVIWNSTNTYGTCSTHSAVLTALIAASVMYNMWSVAPPAVWLLLIITSLLLFQQFFSEMFLFLLCFTFICFSWNIIYCHIFNVRYMLLNKVSLFLWYLCL